MFEKTSRYANCEEAVLQVKEADGSVREVRYARRRFIPAADDLPVLVEHRFARGERLDNLTARYLGDPTQFWRICDGNGAMSAEELEEVGRSIKIAVPGVQG